MNRRRDACILALLLLATAVVFFPVARHEFLAFDDPGYVFDNPHVRAGLGWEGLRWAFTTGAMSNWHPLTWLSHMADAQLFGVEGRVLGLPASGWHHLVSLCFHAANTALLYLFLRAATGAVWRSVFVAALFALHPLHVESVAWAAERKDVLSTLFGLSCLLAYVGWARRGGRARAAVVFVLLALGLLAKPMLVSWPFVMLLLDVWPLQRLQLRDRAQLRARIVEKLPLLALVAASCVATLLAQRSAMHLSEVAPFPLRLENAIVSCALYLEQTVWPAGLAVLYPYPRAIEGSLVGVSAALLLLASWIAWRGAARRPHVAVGWAWFLVTLLPVIGLVQVGLQARADRYTYVPLIGIFVALVWTAAEWVQRRRWPRAVSASAAILLLVGCGVGSARQVRLWCDTATLFRHACSVTLDNGWAHRILANALAEQKRTQEAIDEYREALRIWPDDPVARNNLGCAYLAQRRWEDARAQFELAVRLDPGQASYRRNLTNASAQLERARTRR